MLSAVTHIPPPLLLRRLLLPSRRTLHIASQSEQQQQELKKADYYSLILSSTLPTRTSPSSSPAPPNPHPPAATKPKEETASIIFGSRLAGPAARQKEGWAQERPPEPDNCCMSGCVNCVWDAYREEVEVWAARKKAKIGLGQTEKVEGDRERAGLFEGVPVGIREFMALEKKLREKGEQDDP